MKILIGCEESQVVTKAFRDKGHEAYSCDIQDCSGGHLEWHLMCDIYFALNYTSNIDFFGCHPPCTYLCNSGVRWLVSTKPKKGYVYNKQRKIYINPERWENMVQAALFFESMLCWLRLIGKGYIENPIMHKYAMEIIGTKYDQIIHPHQFGHTASKATCLWIVGLPLLKKTHYLERDKVTQEIHKAPPSGDRAKIRSKTYLGIAMAMADQWG